MPKTIKYTGTQKRWPELAITGKQSVWQPGQQDERSDAEANQLLGTGLFSRVYTVNDLPLASLVSGAGITTAEAKSASLAGSAIGEIRTLSDGRHKGARVRWSVPKGATVPAWTWDIYPLTAFKG